MRQVKLPNGDRVNPEHVTNITVDWNGFAPDAMAPEVAGHYPAVTVYFTHGGAVDLHGPDGIATLALFDALAKEGHAASVDAKADAVLRDAVVQVAKLGDAAMNDLAEIERVLGGALGYPHDGRERMAVTLAREAADRLAKGGVS